MKKLTLLLLLSLGLIGSSYADIKHCSLEEAQSNGMARCYLLHEHDRVPTKSTEWYENGQIESEKNYKDGKLDGKYTWWYENGQKWTENNYKYGELDGKVTKWYENGKIKAEKYYKDGVCIGGDCPN